MTTTTANNGRLCNQIIRNVAVSIIAEKHDLMVTYANKDWIQTLGIELFCGKNNHNETMVLKDDNYFEILNKDTFSYNLDPNGHYFQTKEITFFLYGHFRSKSSAKRIIEKNVFQTRYKNNNDVFVHIRLGDAAQHSPGMDYYLRAIRTVGEFDQLYIASDDIHHPIIRGIIEQYPNAQLNTEPNDEIHTIQFGSTCRFVSWQFFGSDWLLVLFFKYILSSL